MIFLIILILALFQAVMTNFLVANPDYYQLDAYTWESDAFRNMTLGERFIQEPELDFDVLTALMVENDYDLQKIDDLSASPDAILKRRPAEYRKLRQAYETVLKDLKVFPIPKSTSDQTPDILYDDGWMAERSYGSKRGHEGCDIMGNQMPRGFYPVVSVSDGVIEKMGWLEQGGWRMGIRSPSGAYVYYAHLYSYAEGMKEGDHVRAGQLLGYMGDTGYSAIEGTTGNFDVHLHLGIYIKTDHFSELSVNPYWILRYLQKYRLKYKF